MIQSQEKITLSRESYIRKVLQRFAVSVISVFIFFSCSTENKQVYTLVTSTDPVASGIVTPSQGGFDEGTEVEVSAAANDNMVFSGWRGDFNGSENPAVITMNSNKNILAFFVDRQYPLSIHIEGEGTVSERVLQERSTHYAGGTFVELNANPAEGWKLAGWRGDLSGSVNPAVIRMDEAKEITAVFEKREYPLSITIEGEGSVVENVIQERSTDYEYGTLVELTAHPADGWVFSGWGGNLEGTKNPETIIIEQETSITANFIPVDEILALTVQGEGTVNIEQIESEENPSKNRVQLTARPSDGWRFTEWQGDITDTDNPVEIILIEEKAVLAVFEHREYPLTILTEGEGSVTEQVLQQRTADYEDGTVVELTAYAAQGWEFIEWKGDLSGLENPQQITIDSPKEVTAVFAGEPEESTFNIALNIEGEGSVTIDPEQAEYESGSMVELTASPSAGWLFVEWTGDISTSQTSVEITMNSNKVINAVFAKELEESIFNLSADIQGEGSVRIDPELDEYESGSIVELTATPSFGWRFVRWTGDISSAQSSVELTMDSNKEVTALFAEESEGMTFELDLNIEGDGSVTIDPELEEYEEGTMVELTASPSAGWQFVEWKGDISSAQTSVELIMNSDKEVIAVFEEILFDLTINISGNGTVNLNPDLNEFKPGTLVELTAEPSDGWEFNQWQDDITGTENPILITMESSTEVTALFIEQETAFSGGDGSPGNPYRVSTTEQLQAISEYLSSNFIQINNINASSTSGWNSGQGFSPIGSSSMPFTGTFNGSGFEISGLTINRDGDDHVGLFGFTGNAQINNTGLVNVNIIGEDIVGGLAGTNNGQINNSYVTGNVSGEEMIGGLVGLNNGQTTSSHSNAFVYGDDEHVGGLVGVNESNGEIRGSFALGNVEGDDDGVGGLVGTNNGEISNSYATGNVIGEESVGGLVGSNRNSARIVNSYAAGNVSGDDEVGGLAGRNYPNGFIATSYARGNVSGDDETGGFIGWNQGSLTTSYWDSQATNQSNGIGRGNQNELTSLTTSEMTGSSAENNMPGFNWNSVWRTTANYPVLQ